VALGRQFQINEVKLSDCFQTLVNISADSEGEETKSSSEFK